MCCGDPDIIEQFLREEYEETKDIENLDDVLEPEFVALLAKLLVLDPEKRATANQILLSDAWLRMHCLDEEELLEKVDKMKCFK